MAGSDTLPEPRSAWAGRGGEPVTVTSGSSRASASMRAPRGRPHCFVVCEEALAWRLYNLGIALQPPV